MSDSVQWDGRTYPYVPAAELRIDPSLPLHSEVAPELDPVTHEVLRHALWNVNTEHGNITLRISGSPITAYGHDFNPTILDEQGDYVVFGPFLQYLAAATGSAVKWTLENRSANPGIGPGDVFIFNDPWIGATHQADVGVLAPVFVEGKLFCWVGNSMHQWDNGGTAPGGFNPIAEDVFWEAPCIPPVKVVEGGVMRRDIEEHYTRTSRLPDLVRLDLRAEVTGARYAVDRILELVERYGAATVKASMRKLQDDSEAAFLERLATVPDGTWSEESWLEVALPGDRGVYRNRLALTKKGNTLTFSNRGSAPQLGTLSGTLGAWKGAVVTMLNNMLLFDQMFCIEGALRHCEYDVEPGTINCALHPAAVSGAPTALLVQSIGLSGLVLSKMLACSSDPELRTEVQSCMGALCFPQNGIGGVDQRGAEYSSFFLDPLGAALPATSWRDGQDTGGYPWDLSSTMPNVEDTELFYPLLCLWRRELPDSGGAGLFRGGNGGELAFVPHDTERITMTTFAGEAAIPAPGIFGGYPSSTNAYRLLESANRDGELWRRAELPTSLADLPEEGGVWVAPKSFGTKLTPADVWVFRWAGASGYGDPIERDATAVAADVAAGRVTAAWAERVYGVVVAGEAAEATVDEVATASRRQEILAERLSQGHPATDTEVERPAAPGSVPADGPLAESLRVEEGEIRSGEIDLGAADDNYKRAALIRELPLTDCNPHVLDPSIHVDAEVALREVICPRTGRLLAAELVVDGAPASWDLRPGRTEDDIVAAPGAAGRRTE